MGAKKGKKSGQKAKPAPSPPDRSLFWPLLAAAAAVVVAAAGGALLAAGGAQTEEGGGARQLQDDTLPMFSRAMTVSEIEALALTMPCKDTYKSKRMCASWARDGECERNPGYSLVMCAASCEAVGKRGCAMLDPAVRCNAEAMNMSMQPAFEAGELGRMFERIVAPVGPFTEYSPRALSRKPWVVLFENFLSDAEIESLIREAGVPQRSTDQGGYSEHGVQAQVVSSRRTSQNAWCLKDCQNHADVKRVTERISRVTGVPSTNFESFQVLRYDEGQFYRTHHDMNENDERKLAGPRVLTFFLYLSDVEEGGGTNFPRIDLTVNPKRGSAILWSSVLDGNVYKRDDLTHHQALAVERGTKFAANQWIHLFDYATPNLWGCTGSFAS